MPKKVRAFSCEYCDRKFDSAKECQLHETTCGKVDEFCDRFLARFKEGAFVLISRSLVSEQVLTIQSQPYAFHDSQDRYLGRVIGAQIAMGIDDGDNETIADHQVAINLTVEFEMMLNGRNTKENSRHFDHNQFALSFEFVDTAEGFETDEDLKKLIADQCRYVDRWGSEIVFLGEGVDDEKIPEEIDSLINVLTEVKSRLPKK